MKIFILAALITGAQAQVGSAEVVAVMSSESGHYKEAFSGFQEAFGQPIRVVNLQTEKTKTFESKLVVAFGVKAAMEEYQPGTSLIICLAPGASVRPDRPQGISTYIEMAPQAGLLFPKLKALQPLLQRLAIFWASDSLKNYVLQLEKDSASANLKIILVRMADSSLLPERLREIQGKVDAFIVMPDPLIINSQNFTTMKVFSWSNHVPFYVPTAGLVEMGGTACVSSSFKEIGYKAAQVAQNVLKGKPMERTVYADKVEMTINLKAAEQVNLKIPPEVLEKANKVFR